MKRTFLLISAAVLSVIVGVQTALAQKVVLYMSDNQTFEYDIAKLDSIVFCDGQTIPSNEIIVTVDANGNADGGHQFREINSTTFSIDGLIYECENGNLTVISYDANTFSGSAIIISRLIYNGQTMNVVGIGYRAFYICTSLTSVTIPNSVTSIGNEAFWNCTRLTSITIPEGMTSIGNLAFAYCSSLTSITIPESVASIGTSAFSGTPWLENQPDGLVYAGRVAYKYKGTMPEGTEIVIRDGTLGIAGSAFWNCSGLTSVTIPESVISIGESAFADCRNLTSIIIPENVTSIGTNAFYNCISLPSITIPESVTSIGDWAFKNCYFKTESFVNNSSLTNDKNWGATLCDEETSDGLVIKSYTIVRCRPWGVSVTIPNRVTEIGESAFQYCSRLTSVTIHNRVTNIGSYAFSGCSSLTDVYCYAENIPSTFSTAFNNSPISSATLHVPAVSVDAYKAASPWKDFGSIVAIE